MEPIPEQPKESDERSTYRLNEVQEWLRRREWVADVAPFLQRGSEPARAPSAGSHETGMASKWTATPEADVWGALGDSAFLKSLSTYEDDGPAQNRTRAKTSTLPMSHSVLVLCL
jgi:hypothetical protein